MNNRLIHYTTFALPYANGSLHIGHLYEATLADIYAKLRDRYLVSGSDCHGSAITIKALQENKSAQEIVTQNHRAQIAQYKYLSIKLDNFSLTAKNTHHQVIQWCIEKINKNNPQFFIQKKTKSWFDEKENIFLSERYVCGTCAHCQAINQLAGDECKNCSRFIEEKELLNPISLLSKNPLILKETLHLFINNEKFLDFCKTHQELISSQLHGKIFNDNLNNKKEIDISRDKPYFGIDIEGFEEIKNQAFYVWFDAPLGYLTFAFEHWCAKNHQEFTQENFNRFLDKSRFTHFIGKDIVYFHAYFWLNLFHALTNEQHIEKLIVHGWILDKEGQKLSKSNGSFIDLSTWNEAQKDALRIWFCQGFKNAIEDKRIGSDFIEVYNKICVDKFSNFYYRLSILLDKKDISLDNVVLNIKLLEELQLLIQEANYQQVIKKIELYCDILNQQFVQHEAWKLEGQELIDLSQEWLSSFIVIYQILKIICPSLDNLQLNEVFLQVQKTSNAKLPAVILAKNAFHQTLDIYIKIRA